MRFLPFIVSCSALLSLEAGAAEKSFAYFRFTPTRLRDSSASNSVQMAEFRLRFRGTTLNMAQATVTNPEGSSPNGEGPDGLKDGSITTKWLDLNKRAVVFRFPQAVNVDSYSFTTANDAQERDPANWRLEGSSDGNVWILLDEIINGSVPTTRGTTTADFPLSDVVPPYTSFWHPDYLLKWTPASDTSVDYNKSTIPLAARSSNAALKVNANSRSNEGKVTVLTTFGATSFQPSQGAATEKFNAYTGWQYTDKLVFWGGSAGEGLILAPSAPVVDAAHRNGVPVLGNVFLPPTTYGGQYHWVKTFIQKTDNAFPVADKLIEVARTYGFDGWFLNQETAGGNSADAVAMRDFISYFRERAPELEIMWYDSMTEGGNIQWQEAFNENNDMFMKHDGRPVGHSMFLDFGWGNTKMASSRSYADSIGVNPYSIYAGVDVQGAGTGTSVNWDAIFPPGQAHRLSLAFYGAQSMFNDRNPSDFQNAEQRFWVGPNNDPSNTTTTEAWKGIAHYIPPASPLQKVPFVTNFNRGQGNRFAVDGTAMMTTGWNNLSLQDVLPTWRWIVSSSGTKLTPSLELDDAYTGGTSLKIAGNLNAPNDIKLFAASLPVSSDTKFRLIYKSSQGTGATSMKVALSFEDSPQTLTYFDVGNAGTTSWRTFDINLQAYAGRKISTIGLRFENGATINNYQMRIGRIAVFNGSTVVTPAAATNFRVVQQDAQNADTLALRLKWNASATAGIYYYQIIQRFPDGTRKWLGATPNTAFFLPAARRKSAETNLTFDVQAVGADFGVSATTSLTVALPSAPDVTSPMTVPRTWIGTPGAWSGGPDVGANAYDGNISTFFDAQEESAWTGQDYGSGRSRRITAFKFIPRTGWAWRMTGGVFEAANQPDFSDAVTLHSIAVEPADGVYTTVAVVRPELYRYFRHRSNGHGNVGDITVYGYEIPGVPTNLSANNTADGVSITWSGAARARSYRLERASSMAGPFTSLGEITATTFTDTTSPAGQLPFYRVTAINPAGSGAASATVRAVSPYQVWRASSFAGQTSPEVTGPNADPDKDFIPNLLEYALGLNPLGFDALAFSPQLQSGLFTISYPKKVSAAEITLQAQWSDDLSAWSDSGVVYETSAETGGIQTIRATAPSGGTGRRFMRVRAIGP